MKLEKRNNKELLLYLARTVAGQQLSTKAAGTIWQRVVSKSLEHSDSLEDFIDHANFDAIHSCGLSKFKTRAIVELKEAFNNGLICPNRLAAGTHESIRDEITSLWGFGPWSADMVAISFFAMPNVWSDSDASLNRGIGILEDKCNTNSNELIAACNPHRSYLAKHVWLGLDSGKLG